MDNYTPIENVIQWAMFASNPDDAAGRNLARADARDFSCTWLQGFGLEKRFLELASPLKCWINPTQRFLDDLRRLCKNNMRDLPPCGTSAFVVGGEGKFKIGLIIFSLGRYSSLRFTCLRDKLVLLR